MKNIVLLIIALFGLMTVACDPMKDINDDIDKIKKADYTIDTFILARETAPEAYTLTDEDYELSSNEDVAKYKNFSAYALPKDYLPEILNKKFTAPDAFEMQVTYNFYSKPVVDEDNAYVIDEGDGAYYDYYKGEYGEMGQKYIGFNDDVVAESLIGKLLDRKVYASEAGAEKTVKYNEYINNIQRYIQLNADLTIEVLEDSVESYKLNADDYALIGLTYGSYTWLEDATGDDLNDIAVSNGHTLPMVYSVKVYRNFIPTFKVFYHTGTNWEAKPSLTAVTEPLNFSLNADDITLSIWWADPAIKITLGADDYDSNEATSKYDNFDLRAGSIPPGTDRAMLVEMIGAMLDLNHNPVDDQQYLVTYKYYDGGNGITTIRIIRTAGVWSEYIGE